MTKRKISLFIVLFLLCLVGFVMSASIIIWGYVELASIFLSINNVPLATLQIKLILS